MGGKVLITGGSRGIGAAAVKWFYKNGWQVVFSYHQNRDAANDVLNECPHAIALQADISDETQVSMLFERVVALMGGLDCLVCNAGIALPQQLTTDTSVAEFDRLYAVNVKGTFLCCKQAARYMVPNHKGAMVTLSSVWGQIGGSCETAYSATKGAVISFTKALAKELGPSGIRVNCICPGVIDTDMNSHLTKQDRADLADQTAFMRLGSPDEAASAIGFLCGEDASFITGQVLGVDGGFPL
ncbi:MAG: SDR family oxidoreductase [Clostridia bacterium]|nr:SDR family oxidoreductase [Clostridia bacterium]